MLISSQRTIVLACVSLVMRKGQSLLYTDEECAAYMPVFLLGVIINFKLLVRPASRPEVMSSSSGWYNLFSQRRAAAFLGSNFITYLFSSFGPYVARQVGLNINCTSKWNIFVPAP